MRGSAEKGTSGIKGTDLFSKPFELQVSPNIRTQISYSEVATGYEKARWKRAFYGLHLARLLGLRNHVINSSLDFIVRQLHLSTFGRHRTFAFQSRGVKNIFSLSNSWSPCSLVFELGRPGSTGHMAGDACAGKAIKATTAVAVSFFITCYLG